MARVNKRYVALAAVAAAVGGAAVVAARRRRGPQWSTGDDPLGPEGLTLPAGDRRTVTTDDGAELATLVAGPADGPVVVLPHCYTGDMTMWAGVARRLVAGGHRVVLYDQRGHGSSTMGADTLTLDRLGHDLRAVLDDLDVHDVVLGGHSMGGMTIQAFAATDPDDLAARVRGVALVSTAAFIGLRVPARVAEVVLGERSTSTLGRPPSWALRRVVGVDVHRSHVEAAHATLLATTGAARAAALVAIGAMDYRKALPSITVPTTILVGSHDLLTPVPRARVLANGIPGSKLRVLTGFGHMLPLEAPDEVADEIAALAA